MSAKQRGLAADAVDDLARFMSIARTNPEAMAAFDNHVSRALPVIGALPGLPVTSSSFFLAKPLADFLGCDLVA